MGVQDALSGSSKSDLVVTQRPGSDPAAEHPTPKDLTPTQRPQSRYKPLRIEPAELHQGDKTPPRPFADPQVRRTSPPVPYIAAALTSRPTQKQIRTPG